MRAVLTRCLSACVRVDGATVGELPSPGLLALVGVSVSDDIAAAEKMARKIAELRILEGHEGSSTSSSTSQVSALDINAPLLLVSQFTLYGQTAKGRRPSWAQAAAAEAAEPLFDAVCSALRERGLHVETGTFGAMMQVESVNDGPFTVFVET